MGLGHRAGSDKQQSSAVRRLEQEVHAGLKGGR